jgi:pimeloyl-ACP methyl ester carboxylesterase
VGKNPAFMTFAEATEYLARVHAPFGPLPRAYWDEMAMTSIRWDGAHYRLHYDPKIGEVFNAATFDIDLGPTWAAGETPTLLLRGGDSGLFLEETRLAMIVNRPGTESETFPGIGHAPSLAVPDQIERIRDFLLRHRG